MKSLAVNIFAFDLNLIDVTERVIGAKFSHNSFFSLSKSIEFNQFLLNYVRESITRNDTGKY